MAARRPRKRIKRSGIVYFATEGLFAAVDFALAGVPATRAAFASSLVEVVRAPVEGRDPTLALRTVIAGLVDELVRLEAETEARSQQTRAELASMRRQIEHLEESVKARDELLKKVADAVVSGKPRS